MLSVPKVPLDLELADPEESFPSFAVECCRAQRTGAAKPHQEPKKIAIALEGFCCCGASPDATLPSAMWMTGAGFRSGTHQWQKSYDEFLLS